jgi:hypothetical protein
VNVTVRRDIDDDSGSDYERHYLWSVIDHVMVQAGLTAPNDYAVIDWAKLLGGGSVEGAFSYKRAPAYSAAVMITNVSSYTTLKILFTRFLQYLTVNTNWQSIQTLIS